MKFWEHLCRWGGWKKQPCPVDPVLQAREEAVKVAVRRRCDGFRRLLSANKRALEAMSSIEEQLRGHQPFGMDYVRAVSTEVATAVFQMVREVQALSHDGCPGLAEALARITAEMESRLVLPQASTDGPLVIPLQDLRLKDVPLVGGKMAALGELAAHVGLDVPDGFAVTVAAYERFMAHNDLRGELERRIQATDTSDLDQLFSLSAALQQCVLSASLPSELETAITDSVDAMHARAGDGLLLAVRSSAVGEDGAQASFAGQYRSELDVLPEEVCQVWKEIVAAKYSLTAMTYRRQHGIPDSAVPMGVGVLAMVRAVAGGVAYSQDPLYPGPEGRLVINAVNGLPRGVVDGTITPHTYVCSRSSPPQLLETHPGEGPLPLAADQVQRLARVALALEEYHNVPQDVEWALDGSSGRIIILQSRPLQVVERSADTRLEQRMDAVDDDLPLLASGGIPVSPGLAVGEVFVARKEADMLAFPEGAILVIERAWPRWAPLLSRAAGLVSESGGLAGHLASVAREYALPAIFGLTDACRLLEGAGQVTLDADHGRILAGRNPSVMSDSAAVRPNLMMDSPVFRCLQDVARLVTPLHLLDPSSPDFAPDHCRSLHDITRFCHENSVRLMLSGEGDVSGQIGKQLRAGAKLQYWVLDMGSGFSEVVTGPIVDLSHIASCPMLALWDGLTAVPWAGPPAVDAGGMMSAIFESAMNPALESMAANSMAERNIFIIDRRYMLLQARYGYHFCTVESLADDQAHENFVNFQFKGGAADMRRRCLRASLLADVLEEQGFRTEARQDALFAVAEGLDRIQTLQKTALLGYVLLHSRQTDMIMQDHVRSQSLRNKWCEDMAVLVRDWPHRWDNICRKNHVD